MIVLHETATRITMSSEQPDPSDTSPPLHELLDANLLLPSEYQAQFTNHLPMALHALHSLGASPERLREFFAVYARRFRGGTQENVVRRSLFPVADWLRLRGQEDAFPSLLAYFNRMVASQGMEVALHIALPNLMPGVAAAAFHGVIRTAHAVQAAHAGELATALAYWAWRWQPLTAPPVGNPLIGFDSWAKLLIEQASGWHSDGQLISIRMNEASQSRAYVALAGALMPAATIETRIADLAQLAVDRYVLRPNFTILHMITGLRALRTLLPWIQDSENLQATVVHCFVAAYLAARVTTTDPVIIPKAKSWSEVIKVALTSDDEHLVKLVHACRDEAAKYGDGQYLIAATMATSS
jgi:hypothetical protein